MPRLGRYVAVIRTKPPFIMREVERGDASAILGLARSLEKWFGSVGLAQIARDLESHKGYVAVREGRLLGFVTWTPVDETMAELSWIGIAEDVQHEGVGTALLSALTSRLRRDGFHDLTVSTIADSFDFEPYAETRRFYRARGFKDYRVDPRYWAEGDARYDRLVMRLDLTH
jgi:ribosomal protein S18 acetylase RimI-like enzyme